MLEFLGGMICYLSYKKSEGEIGKHRKNGDTEKMRKDGKRNGYYQQTEELKD